MAAIVVVGVVATSGDVRFLEARNAAFAKNFLVNAMRPRGLPDEDYQAIAHFTSLPHVWLKRDDRHPNSSGGVGRYGRTV